MMGFLSFVADVLVSVAKEAAGKNGGSRDGTLGAIDYGQQKKDGSHDHRYNTGKDRTTAQKVAIRHTKRLASKFIAEVPRCAWPHLAATYITSSETRLT